MKRWVYHLIWMSLLCLPQAYLSAEPVAAIAPFDLPRDQGPVIESATPPPTYPDLRIEINIPATTLTLFEDHQPTKIYQIAVGSPRFPTPARHDAIEMIIWNPWWLPPDSAWAKDEVDTPPGPKNPLGPVKMLLGDGIRIHGTLTPSSIGSAASHGCFRMYNADAKELARTIQEKMSSQSSPAIFKKYEQHPRQSFYVTLTRPLPVDVIYQPVELSNNLVHLYPDYYRHVASYPRAVYDRLVMAGIHPTNIDVDQLLRLPSPTPQEPLTIPLRELLIDPTRHH